MPNPATIRKQRLRKTKAQLIDEIDTVEQRAAAIEACHPAVTPRTVRTAQWLSLSTYLKQSLARLETASSVPTQAGA